MSARGSFAAAIAAAVVVMGLGLTAFALLPTATADLAATRYAPAIGLVTAVSMVVLVWRVDPAYSLSGAIFLTPLAGNWPQLGVPGPLSPDRLLLAGGIVAVVLRAPPVADRPRLRISGTHWLLAVAVLYALVSALFAGTLLQNAPFLKLVDAFGIMPFLLFLVAPLAFRTPRQRGVLLGTLVALGAYLGLTVLFATAKLDALVFPKYILDPNFGIHAGRGRGPFVDAVANGLALYTCSVACAIAAATWRRRGMRALAVGIGVLCLVGSFLSLERSVWIGAVLGTIVAMLATRGLRRYLVPVAVAAAVAIVASLALIPGLTQSVDERAGQERTIWDRKNLARAAINMVEARPLFGYGWGRFSSESTDYFEQAFDYPLTATSSGVHNTPLNYAVDLGLIGMTLWVLGVMFGVGGALATRGPPDLVRWRVGLLAVATAYLVVLSAVPPTAWLNRSLWLLAGVVYSGRYIESQTLRRDDDTLQPSA
jgi:putative inorganic carbon (hco3(-)) transporter